GPSGRIANRLATDAGLILRPIRVGGGAAPVRAYIEELLPDVLDGKIEPGRIFDRVIGLDEVPDGYRAMNERKANQGDGEAVKANQPCGGRDKATTNYASCRLRRNMRRSGRDGSRPRRLSG